LPYSCSKRYYSHQILGCFAKNAAQEQTASNAQGAQTILASKAGDNLEKNKELRG
jgi:hypothetical protein